MRYPTELDYVLKIREGQGLPKDPQLGVVYEFTKTIERIYPLRIPILLVDDDLNAYGKCVILQTNVGKGNTTGLYEIVSLFDEEERKIFTKDIKESFEIAKTLEERMNQP
ncbi:hypothetical protein CEE44_01280 [Candidatus Woesearchaeota archaeon B3_Woes]|nr:MAG: hypothetical protein CEE44_01280 [Candidatus Woesearchaeota archaeon B3_Woes]